MAAFPVAIAEFLRNHHVLTLCVHTPQTVWAANCFYAFDSQVNALYLLSHLNTQHAQMMLLSPQVAGTVYGKTMPIEAIQGVQYRATAVLLADEIAHAAYAQYYQRFPFARALPPAPIWALTLTEAKLTDNKQRIGNKLTWCKEESSE